MTSRYSTLIALSAAGLLAVLVLIPSTQAVAEQGSTISEITFYKEVLPILQARCQTCHRPGEIAPMSLLTYSEARPWARSIKEAVITRTMPPWFAEPGHRKFENDPSLTDEEIQTLVRWADGGAAEGNRADAPAPVEFLDGWNIEPDMIVEMPIPFEVPAEGTINYQNVLVPVNFSEDKWVSAAEMRGGNRAVVHHMRGG